jgi:hypothetical protein
LARTQLVAGDNDLLAPLKLRRRTFDDDACRVDSRHMRQLTDDARVSLRGEGILVIQRGVMHADQHVAQRQICEGPPGQPALDLTSVIFFNQETG